MPYVDTAITNLITLQVDRCVGVNYYTDNELIRGACVFSFTFSCGEAAIVVLITESDDG